MKSYARIEAETETHRLEKAVQSLVSGGALPFRVGTVCIDLDDAIVGMPGAQRLLVMLTQQLARMKGIVRKITITPNIDVPLCRGIPLHGSTLRAGLEHLIHSLSGSQSTYRTEFSTTTNSGHVRVGLAAGDSDAEIIVGADAWRGLLGSYAKQARWTDECPLGPYFAATLAAAEVFKRLLQINFGWHDGLLVDNVAYSLLDYSQDECAAIGPDFASLILHNLAIAGIGAGGTATLYTLASFPDLRGEITGVEPGRLKKSNLGRYLMTEYDDVHDQVHKLTSASRFLRAFAPSLRFEPIDALWHDVSREWTSVVATVDTPEARWDVQRSRPRSLLEGGVMGLLFAALRVVPNGWCLECKHPPDPDLMWKRRAARWGLTLEEVRSRYQNCVPVSSLDIERLADVQGRPTSDFNTLIGVPFDKVPAITECGEAALALSVPSQAPVLPMSTTAVGIVLAAEIIKDVLGIGQPLNNYLVQDLRFGLKASGLRYKPRLMACQSVSHLD